MKRVVILKTCTFDHMALRRGLTHALPEAKADALIGAGIACLEGEEPRFCEKDLEAFDRKAAYQQEVASRLARLQAARDRAALEQAQAQREQHRKAVQRAAQLRLTRGDK